MITLNDLRVAREWGLREHQTWKAQITVNDAVAAGEWQILWDDSTVEPSEPLIENIYTQALEDKMSAAGTILPRLFVPFVSSKPVGAGLGLGLVICTVGATVEAKKLRTSGTETSPRLSTALMANV